MAALTLNVSESLLTTDALRRNAKGAVSDIAIDVVDLTQAGFAALLLDGSSPEYGGFKSFMVGDHQYEDAIIKCVMQSESAAAPRITAFRVDIDVPDIFDKGGVTTSTSALVAVTFARPFHAVPDVTGSLLSGTVIGVPNIKNVTITGFDIELLDSTNARIVGLISWHAKGY